MAGAFWFIDAPAMRQIVAVVRHVVVAIDQTRQHRHAGTIHNFGIGGKITRVLCRYRTDLIAIDNDRRVPGRSLARAVNQPRILED
jgi:hypothetical protein